jgi:hypothetical protein
MLGLIVVGCLGILVGIILIFVSFEDDGLIMPAGLCLALSVFLVILGVEAGREKEPTQKPVESKTEVSGAKTYTWKEVFKKIDECKDIGLHFKNMVGVPVHYACNVDTPDGHRVQALQYDQISDFIKCKKLNGNFQNALENTPCKVGKHVLKLQELDSYIKTKEILDSARPAKKEKK